MVGLNFRMTEEKNHCTCDNSKEMFSSFQVIKTCVEKYSYNKAMICRTTSPAGWRLKLLMTE